MTTEIKRILHIHDVIENINNYQLAVESSEDSDLGFRMWGGKDAVGNITKWLAKDKAGRLSELTITELSYAMVASDATGKIYNIDSLAELNAILGTSIDESDDPREPLAHAASHAQTGYTPDPITISTIQGIQVEATEPTPTYVLTAVDIGGGDIELQWKAPAADSRDATALQGVAISDVAPGENYVLRHNGSTWAAQPIAEDSRDAISLQGIAIDATAPGENYNLRYTAATGWKPQPDIVATIISAAAGTAAAPSFTFTGDLDTGLYWIGENSLGIVVGGVHSATIDAYRNFVIGATTGTARFQVVQGTAGPGTVAVSGTAVTGTATQFTNTFKVGDTITVTTTSGSETKAIATITSDTVLVTAAFSGTAAAGTAYTLAGGTRFSVYGNGNLTIGTLTGTAAILNLPTATTAAGGINFGGDVSLYRSAADVLKTDDTFTVAGAIVMGATQLLKDGNNRTFIVLDNQYNTGAAMTIGVNSNSQNLIIGASAHYAKNWDHASQTNPTVFLHSVIDPDTNNTQWLSLVHNQIDAVCATGLGNLILSPASNVVVGTSPTAALSQKFSVWGGNESIVDATYLGSESLTDGTSPSDTNWDATNDCTFDGGTGGPVKWIYSAGTASTLTQLSATLAVPLRGGRWYSFTYTVKSAAASPTANITTAAALTTTALTMVTTASPLTYTIYFKSAVTPTNFVITSTLTTGQSFVLGTLILKEVFGGDLYASGNVGIGTHIFGSNARHSLALGLGTVPGSSLPDQIELFAVDGAGSTTTLGLRTEVALVTGSMTQTKTLEVYINGEKCYLLLSHDQA